VGVRLGGATDQYLKAAIAVWHYFHRPNHHYLHFQPTYLSPTDTRQMNAYGGEPVVFRAMSPEAVDIHLRSNHLCNSYIDDHHRWWL